MDSSNSSKYSHDSAEISNTEYSFELKKKHDLEAKKYFSNSEIRQQLQQKPPQYKNNNLDELEKKIQNLEKRIQYSKRDEQDFEISSDDSRNLKIQNPITIKQENKKEVQIQKEQETIQILKSEYNAFKNEIEILKEENERIAEKLKKLQEKSSKQKESIIKPQLPFKEKQIAAFLESLKEDDPNKSKIKKELALLLRNQKVNMFKLFRKSQQNPFRKGQEII